MRVLFLLSCLEPAGSETYCLTLSRAWKGTHEVFWISDSLHFGQTYVSYPIHKKIFPGGIQNVFRVLKFVRENKIEIIHSHSRRANWVASQVSRLAKIPHITTIHQPPPVHFFSKLSPCLGDHTIAIDEVVQEHLQKHFKHGIKRLSLIRNGIELNASPPNPSPDGRGEYEVRGEAKVLYLGRLTGGRWRALEFFFSALKRFGKSLPQTRFVVVGRIPEERAALMKRHLSEVNQAIAPSVVETHDFVGNLAPLIGEAYGVIGAGRSALESLALGKPVIALGEKAVIGLCEEESWPEVMRTNFGDHIAGENQFYPAHLEFGLRKMLDPNTVPPGTWGRAQVERYYNIATVARQIETLYKEAFT